MRERSFRQRAFLPILVLAGFALFQTTGRTQEVSRRALKDAAQVKAAREADPRGDEAGLSRLAQRLIHFRAIGDLESAARVFGRLFPSDAAGDPATASKTGAALPSDRPDGPTGNVKPVLAVAGAYPVFVSPEPEKNPSAGISRSSDGTWTIFSAAEQWTGGRPGDIRIRKSSDLGRTWPETVLIGDSRPATHPALRQVADEAIGVAYVKEWDGADGDIHFARLNGAMSSHAEFPVALSLSDQRSPSLATDRLAYDVPYLYVVYAERDGPSGSIKFRVSQDLGGSWSRAMTIDTFPWPGRAAVETAMAFDPGKNALHVAYSRPQGPSAGIAAVTSADFGASWSRPAFLTPVDDRVDSSPAIAAGNGTVIVVYEHETAASGGDIGLAFSADSGKRWATGPGLASSAASETSPDIQASEGGSPRFFASYVEGNGQVRVVSAEGPTPGSWTMEAAFPEHDGLAGLGSAIVLPMPGREGGESAGILWADTSADEDIYFSATAITLSLADLVVTPGNQDVSFMQGTTSFSVTKTGEEQVDWTADVVSGGSWLSIQSGSSGTDAGTIVAAYAQNSAADERAGSIRVTPKDTAIPSVTVTVTQEGAPVGTLSVTPASGLTSTGIEGGPFSPSSQAYVLRNVGTTSISWRAARVQVWTSLSALSGTLGPGATRTVTVTINAGAETLSPGTYSDTVSFMNTTNGNGNTTRPVSLTVSSSAGSLSVAPADGLTSTGTVGGPFAPASQDYTLHNPGLTSIDWTAGKTQAWMSLSAVSGTLAAGATSTVTVSINAAADALAAGTYNDTVTFTNVTNGTGNTTRGVTLTISAPAGALSVTPAGGLASAGTVGGPFTPSSQTYTLENTGGTSISWTAGKTQAWASLSAVSGTLAAGTTATVTVSINAAAGALAAGTYNDTVTFTNVTNGTGNTTRGVTLTVSAPAGALSVTPAGGFASAGTAGGPFTPSSQAYTLENTGGTSISWTAGKTQAWTTLSAVSGTLTGGATATVTVSINATANALAAGTYNDMVTFTNTTNGSGNTTRSVVLDISAGPILAVSPSGRSVAFAAGSTTFAVSNAGGGTFTWTAAVVSGGAWLAITSGSGGTDTGTITVTFDENRTSSDRVGIIRVTAPGATGSPKDVTITQGWGTLSLNLSAQRLVEKAWIIQRQYGGLTVAIVNPASIPIDRYVIYRKAGSGDLQTLATVSGSTVVGGQLTYADMFLEPGTSYTYKVVAYDALGTAVVESLEVTI